MRREVRQPYRHDQRVVSPMIFYAFAGSAAWLLEQPHRAKPCF